MGSAYAQTDLYPSRPITVIVSVGAGSATDLLARAIAPALGSKLGQSVIVDNKPGAGSLIGTSAIARARPDGYTFGIVSTSAFGINPHLYRNLPYDVQKDFTPVTEMTVTPNALVVSTHSEINSLRDLLAEMKSRRLRYNSFGNGTTQHLAGALLVSQVGASADHIPYRNTGDMMTALIGGRESGQSIDFAFQALPAVVSYVRSGQLRVIGVTTPTPAVPSAPVLDEQGLNDFSRTSVWFGLVGPAGIDPKIVDIVYKAVVGVLADPVVQGRLQAAGFIPAVSKSPAEFGRFVTDQLQFWKGVVKISGAKVE